LNQAIEKEIISQLSKLPREKQREVLYFVRALTVEQPVGIPGKELLSFAGSIESHDLEIMARVIEEDCEKVNLNEW
jgi:hypothetical protein